MKQLIKLKILILSLVISTLLTLKLNAQTSVSISAGIMEHRVGIPNFKSDDLLIISKNLTLKHFFEKQNFEIGLSYYSFGGRIENSAYNFPSEYSYWYTVRRPINLIAYCGIRSDRDKFIQTYGGIITGYWSYKMDFSSENYDNLNDFESIKERIHQFALGPKFGLSIGRKVQLIIEAEYFLLTKTKYTYRYFERVSTINLGLKYNFKGKKTDNNGNS